jgi:hypothetical protein
MYEGWVVIGETPVTTGKFQDPASGDYFDLYSGKDTPYPFPGEDFLSNPPRGSKFPTNLSGSEVFVTVEPVIDDDPGPFQFMVLRGKVPLKASDDVPYSVSDSTFGLPHGSARFVPSSNGGGDPDAAWLFLIGIFAVILVLLLVGILATGRRGI